jgi:hypothetical protein
VDSNTDGQAPSSRRLVRIRVYLVSDGRQIFGQRVYVKTLELTAEAMPAVEVYLNQLLEQIAVEHKEERPPGDYRLELTDNVTGELLMDWRYVPPTTPWWHR